MSRKNNPYRLFLATLREHWLIYTFGMLAMLITSFSEIMLPKFIQWAIDLTRGSAEAPRLLQRANASDTLDLLVLCLLANLSVGWLGRVLWRQILARQSHRAGHRIKTRIWDILKDQPLTLLDRHSLGDLMNRATGDWNRTRFIHGFTIVMSFDLIFFGLLATLSMLMIDWKTALLCLVILPFLPRPILRISREEYKLHGVAQEQLSSLSDLIAQSVGTVRLQRSTGSEDVWLKRLNSYAEEYAKRQFRVLKANWRIYNLASIPTLFSYAVLYSWGLYQISRGELTLGAFLALQSYVLLMQGPLFELGNNISEWQTGFASYKRIAELYDLKREERLQGARTGKDLPAPAISLKGLSVRFEEGKRVLDHLDLDVLPGERLGFMGPIGSGKSTLVQVVAGLEERYEGGLRIFGRDPENESRRWLAAQITMVPQKAFLFAGTIRHNLSLAEEKTDEEPLRALACVELSADLEHFPKGLDSWIGEWGLNLSGGQKQRLALARALLKPSPILILDDCLSAVDSVTEARILKNLMGFVEGRAVLWTAHRLSSLQLCTKIYRMEQGRIHELDRNPLHGAEIFLGSPSHAAS